MRLAHASDSTDVLRAVKSAAETGTAGASAAEKSGARIPTGRAPCGRLPAPSDGLPSSRFDRFRGHPVGVKSLTGVQGRDFVGLKLFFYTFFFLVFLTCN